MELATDEEKMYMEEALKEAALAALEGEIPVGPFSSRMDASLPGTITDGKERMMPRPMQKSLSSGKPVKSSGAGA